MPGPMKHDRPEGQRRRLMEAYAAIDRACRAFSNNPEWTELNEYRQNFDVTMKRIVTNRGWGAVR